MISRKKYNFQPTRRRNRRICMPRLEICKWFTHRRRFIKKINNSSKKKKMKKKYTVLLVNKIYFFYCKKKQSRIGKILIFISICIEPDRCLICQVCNTNPRDCSLLWVNLEWLGINFLNKKYLRPSCRRWKSLNPRKRGEINI